MHVNCYKYLTYIGLTTPLKFTKKSYFREKKWKLPLGTSHKKRLNGKKLKIQFVGHRGNRYSYVGSSSKCDPNVTKYFELSSFDILIH